MTLKFYYPITPGQRHRINILKKKIVSNGVYNINKLSIGKKVSSGRNNFGHITVKSRGGGNKIRYRIIDFKRNLFNTKAKVLSIEYDPNRSSYIALIAYNLGVLSYILSSENLAVGDIVENGENAAIKEGNALPLYKIPVGTLIHNIEQNPGFGGQLVRSAGCFAVLQQKIFKMVLIKMPSGKYLLISDRCIASIGKVSNEEYQNIVLGKAGVSRWLNKRPHVRGVAMNPVDHPHGGNTAGGRPSVSPWGILTKGYKTNRKLKKQRNKNKFK